MDYQAIAALLEKFQGEWDAISQQLVEIRERLDALDGGGDPDPDESEDLEMLAALFDDDDEE